MSAPVEMTAVRFQRSSLGSNITAMYALQITNYLIPLLTLPYLIRVLGAQQYGVMAMAYALVYFLVLFVDAGFNTRAVRLLSRPGITAAQINEVYATTQWIKLGQSVAVLAVLLLLINTVPLLRQHAEIYLASYMIVAGSLLFPTWLFQGLQIMHFTTLCSTGGRMLATGGIFLLVREPGDLVIAALLQASATAMSGVLSLPLVQHRLHLTLLLPTSELLPAIRRALRDACKLGISEYITNATANAGVFILGLFSAESVVGIYAALSKVAQAGVNAFQPLIKSLFPAVAAHWSGAAPEAADYSRRWSRRIVATALAASAVLYIVAPRALEILFGQGWAGHGVLLRTLAVWLFLSVASAVAGQFWLLARGRNSLYAGCLMITGVIQVTACVIGAMHYGIRGVVWSMVLAEVARLTLFVLALAGRSRGEAI